MIRKGIKQHDIRDCGAACLATICMHYKLKIPLVHIREKMRVDKGGASLYSIVQTAKYFNFNAEAFHATWEEFFFCFMNSEIKLPAIAHIITNSSMHHFIVIKKIKRNKIIVFDPAEGEINYTFNEFNDMWTGYIITLEKTKEFKKENRNKETYKKYFSLLKKYKSILFNVIIISLFLSAISMISAFIYQKLIDQYLTIGQNVNSGFWDNLNLFSNINYIFIFMIILYLIQFTIFILRGYLLSLFSRKFSEKMTSDFLEHLLALPMYYFKDRETGEILSRFNNIGQIRDILSSGTLTLILDSIMVIAGGIILASINIYLFFMVLALSITYGIIILLFRNTISDTNRTIMENDAQLTSLLKESIEGIETIKTLNGESKFYDRLHNLSTIFIKSIYKGNLIGVSQTGILMVVEGIGVIVILWLGSLMVVKNILSLGSLLAFLNLVHFFLAPVQRLISLQLEIQQAIIAIERLNDILEIKKESKPGITNNIKSLKKQKIIINNLTFRYGYRDSILKNLSFNIESNDKIAIVGPNGSGKSTLLHLLSGFYPINDGELMFGDTNIREIPLNILRKDISYVSQNTILFSGTVKDNLTLGIDTILDEELDLIIKGCKLNELFEQLYLGINTMISENGKELSGGQKQKIAIARALLTKPSILVLDESTSNLDGQTEKAIINFINNEYRDITCFYATHNINIIKNCSKVIFLEDGQIKGFGSHEELFQNNLKYANFAQQMLFS
ncbi:MAG: peptidase domain-containing ABC transporter [Clostridiales bacterium]|nr:peptidase domain-containing ABC transporter [Clostridiales bacterium]